MALAGNTAYGMLNPGTTTAAKPITPASAQTAADDAAKKAVQVPPGSANPYDLSNLPFQGIYNEDQAAANKAYQDAVTGLQQQRSGYNNQYGFNDQGQEDPNNPLGLFQLQRGQEALGLDNARNDAVGRGIGTIGLGAQAENQLHFQDDAADNQLLGTYRGLLNENDQGQLGAANTLTASLLDARRKQIQNAIDSGYFNPAQPDNSYDMSNLPDDPGFYDENPNFDPVSATAGMFDGLNNLSPTDWAKIAALPVNKSAAKAKLIKTVAKSSGSRSVGLTDTSSSAHVAAARPAPKPEPKSEPKPKKKGRN